MLPLLETGMVAHRKISVKQAQLLFTLHILCQIDKEMVDFPGFL